MAYQYNVADGLTYWVDDAPDASAQQSEQQALQQQVLDWYKDQGYDAFVPQIGQQYDRWGSTGGLYNAGNGVMAYVPTEGAAAEPFIAPPQHNDTLGEAWGDWLSLRKNGGHAIPLIAATVGMASGALGGAAAAEGGAAGAGATAGEGVAGGAALAGGGEVGSGYAASAPGWWGGAEAGGTLAGSAGSESLAGSAGSDTVGGGTMGEDLFYDPAYGYDAGGGYYDPSYAGGGEVGSGYPASAPGGDATGGGSGGWSLEDLYKMGQQGYGYAKQAKSIYDQYKGLFGAAAGAAAGAFGTPKQSGTTTTTEDLPDWLKGPAQVGVSGLANAYAANPTGQTPLLQGGSQYLTDVINGKYLNNNPYLDAMYDKAAAKVSAGVNALFSKGGRYGSGAHQGVLGEQLGNLATDIYAGNYAKERTNQQAVGMQSPQLSSSILSSGFVPAQNLLTGIGAVRSRNISTPYYDSTLNNIISGALGGKSLFG